MAVRWLLLALFLVMPTLVHAGATIGAGCIIGNDLTIGRFAMVGMGSVVTKSIPDFYLVMGQPARPVGVVCKCGPMIHRFGGNPAETNAQARCTDCGAVYSIHSGVVTPAEEMSEDAAA